MNIQELKDIILQKFFSKFKINSSFMEDIRNYFDARIKLAKRGTLSQEMKRRTRTTARYLGPKKTKRLI